MTLPAKVKSSLIVLCALAALLPHLAWAVVYVATGKITMIENGWSGESVVFHHSGPGISGCGTSNEFVIDKTHPGYKEMVTLALATYATSPNVELVVDQGVCLGVHTKVLAINMKK